MKNTEVNKEVEFGVKIKRSAKLEKFLENLGGKASIVKIDRHIYKNPRSNYFFKISTEKKENLISSQFSMKEDLISKGKTEGMKIAEEIDIDVSKEQLENLTKIIKHLGFNLDATINKIRKEFKVNDLQITIDQYGTDETDYLEVEGSDEKLIMELVKILPYEKVDQK